jgi:cbb3-type cytochrome oxidase maturation protein
MEVIIILAPFTILLALTFLVFFLKSNKSGQFDNLETEQYKLLIEDTKEERKENEQ